jgi:hypothetical protein
MSRIVEWKVRVVINSDVEMSGRGRPRFGKRMMRLSMSYTLRYLLGLGTQTPAAGHTSKSNHSIAGRYYIPAAAIARLTWSSGAELILASNSLSESVEGVVD